MNHKRRLGLFFLFLWLQSTFLPTFSWALASSPITPEVSSFEPVDMTDMVNLTSGDFSYSLPLLEVPGPDGGYPINLFYHSGVKTHQDASWAGLGWDINPGAINRDVSGIPDDAYSAEYSWNNAVQHSNGQSIYDFWEGGQSNTQFFSVGLGYAGVNFNMGYSETRDTYKGTFGDIAMGLGYGWGPVQANANLSSNGNLTMGIGFGGGGGGASLGMNLSLTTNFHGYTSAGVGYGLNVAGLNTFSVGWDLSSGNGASVSAMGISGNSASGNHGKMSTRESGFNANIPLFTPWGVSANIGFGYKNIRYWYRQQSDIKQFGSLYPNKLDATQGEPWLMANFFDSYTNPDYLDEGYDPLTAEHTKDMGGGFPDIDNYNVLGQGIGGQMEPQYFEIGSLYTQALLNENNTIYAKSIIDKKNDTKPNFRFLGESLNYYLDDPGNDIGGSGFNSTTNNYEFTNVLNPAQTSSYFNSSSKRLAGAKHVEWVSNTDIESGDYKGVILPETAWNVPVMQNALVQAYYGKEQLLPTIGNSGVDVEAAVMDHSIRAFAITNADGVTYHYSLPAYAYCERTFTEKFDDKGKQVFKLSQSNVPYAYTWHLTAITGPDFVDRGGDAGNGNHVIDDNDYGYWVKFDYGLWTENYSWRNPSIGMHKDDLTGAKTFSSGKKQIYYLDKIETRTHCAIFIKDVRNDGKGVTDIRKTGGHDPVVNTLKLGSDVLANYIVNDDVKKDICVDYNPSNQTVNLHGDDAYLYSISYLERPESLLMLKDIYIIKKDKMDPLKISKAKGNKYAFVSTYSSLMNSLISNNNFNVAHWNDCQDNGNIVQGTPSNYTYKLHNADNVYDKYDFYDVSGYPTADLNYLRANTIRAVHFNYDYELCPNTINSFKDDGTLYDPNANSTNYALDGKLTLQSVLFNGLSDRSVLPPVTFKYDNEYSGGMISLVTLGQTTQVSISSGTVQYGDIIKIWEPSNPTKVYYGQFQSNNLSELRMLGDKPLTALTNCLFYVTKNPPFSNDCYDIWGYYKSDYQEVAGNLINFDRLTTDLSAKNTDAWSLRSISIPTGGKIIIGYESDSYSDVVLYKKDLLACDKSDLTQGFDNLYHQTTPVGTPIVSNYLIGSTGTASIPLQIPASQLSPFIHAGDVCMFCGIIEEDIRDIAIDPGNVSQPISSISKKYCKLQDIPLTVTSVSNGVINADVPVASLQDLNPDPPSWQGGLQIYHYIGASKIESGFLKLNKEHNFFGGGIRVRNLGVQTGIDNKKLSTTYEYTKTNSTEVSSGWTSYLPLGAFQAIATKKGIDNGYLDLLYRNVDKILALSREIPSPSVMYEYVRLKDYDEEGNQSLGYKEYQFKKFEKDMVGRVPDEETSGDATYGSAIFKRAKRSYVDKTSAIGILLSMRIFNNSNEKVASYENEYSTDLPGHLGQVTQSFLMHNLAVEQSNFVHRGILSTRKYYPTVQTRSIAIQDGRTTENKNLDFDLLTGLPLITQSLSSDGQPIVSKTVVAKSNYPELDSKVFSNSNKNMLTQVAEQYVYLLNVSNDHLLTASIQTWRKDWQYIMYDDNIKGYRLSTNASSDDQERGPGVWRKAQAWVFKDDVKKDGSVLDFVAFNWNSINQVSKWQKTTDIVFYDHFSKPIEEVDVNGNYSAVKIGYGQSLITGTSNSKYGAFATTSFEDRVGASNWFSAEIQGANNVVNAPQVFGYSTAHTGSKMLQVNGPDVLIYSAQAATGFEMGHKYHAAIWNKSDGLGRMMVKVTMANNVYTYYADLVQNVNSAGWVLQNLDFDVPSSALQVDVYLTKGNSVQTFYDDFRICPFQSSVNSFVYDEMTSQLTYSLDNDNFYTHYTYDNAGRLSGTYKETANGIHKVSKVEYHYKGQ